MRGGDGFRSLAIRHPNPTTTEIIVLTVVIPHSIGVSWDNRSAKKPWVAKVWIPGKGQKHVGCFASEEEAARAYDIKAREWWGDDAIVNFFHDGSRNLEVRSK